MTTSSDVELGRWQEKAPTTLDAEDLFIGVVRSYEDGEEPPEAPNGVALQMSIDFMGIPLALVAKFDVAEAEELVGKINVCIEAVKTGTIPEVPAG